MSGAGEGCAPPTFARRWLSRLLGSHRPDRDPGTAAEILAGLGELYRMRVDRDGAGVARRWYWRQVAGFALRRAALRPGGRGPRRTPGRRGSGDAFRELAVVARSLRHRPGFALLAVGTLAIGIAANAIVFSVLDTTLWRPLPFPDADRLVAIRLQLPRENRTPFATFAQFRAWQALEDGAVEAMAGYLGRSRLIGLPGNVVYELGSHAASPGFFELLGGRAAIGRVLVADDYRPDAQPVAVVSDAFRQARLAGADEVVGRTIEINGLTHTIVGVLAPDFRFDTFNTEIYTPLKPAGVGATDGDEPIRIVARLRRGATAEQLVPELQSAILEQGAVALVVQTEPPVPLVVSIRAHLYDWVGERFGPFMGVVAFVLLLVAANLANLTLARATGRADELALRLALGAGRWRLARLVAVEILLITALAAALGTLMSYWGVRLLVALNPLNVARIHPIFDTRVVAFATAVALLAGLLAAAWPAVNAWRSDFRGALGRGARHATDGGSRRLAQRAMVVLQIAGSLLLLTGAGLLAKTTVRMYQYDPGIDTRNLLRFYARVPEEITDGAARLELAERTVDAVRALPGVAGASVVESGDSLSHGLTDTSGGVTLEGQGERLPIAATTDRGSYSYVVDDHFDVLGIPPLRGRSFAPADAGATVAMVNEEAAHRWWPDARGEVVGKRFKLGPPASESPWLTVVGVVPTTRTNSVQALDWEPAARAYLPLARGHGASIYYFYVRTAADPSAIVPSLRATLAEVSPGMLVRNPSDEGAYLAEEIAFFRVSADIVTAFAAFAVVLAAMGVYGVVAYGVARRTREIGVRIALGARKVDVLKTISVESALLATLGITGGVLLSAAFTRGLESMLYGIDPLDSSVFVAAAVLFAAVVALATYLPARRAAAVDPVIALRSE